MEDGGYSAFDFVVKGHKLITLKKLDISEWHRICKLIFKQMIEAIEFIHSHNIAHMDISLENMVINDIDIIVIDDGSEKIKFVSDKNGSGDGVQIKLCDFGLFIIHFIYIYL